MTAGILDPGPQLAAAEFSPNEQALIDRIDKRKSHTVEEVAVGLGLIFLLYRMYMKRRIKEEMNGKEPGNLALVAGSVYTALTPAMVRLVGMHLVFGYLEGVSTVHAGTVPEEMLTDIAEEYAAQLAKHLNEVSMDAMMRGYNQQVNRKVPARKAVQNVISAYGVPVRTMNALVQVWTSEDAKLLTAMPAASQRDARAAAIIDKALAVRGQQIGDTESWNARCTGKQLVWMYAVQRGLLPEDVGKVWSTAHDERVCPVCGPLSKAEVPLNEPFTGSFGSTWTPPLHPGCRCDIHLSVRLSPIHEEELVGKAYDPHEKRDRRGRWTRTLDGPKINLQPIQLPDQVIDIGEKELPPLPGTLPPLPGTEHQKVSIGGKISLGPKASLRPISLDKISLDDTPQEKVSLQPTKRSLPKVSLPQVSLPSEAAIKISLGVPVTPPRSSNDLWVVMPEPLYTVIDSGNRVGETAFIDDQQAFYRYADVKPVLKRHWDTWIENEVAEHAAGDMPATHYKLADNDGFWDIDQFAYQELLEWYLAGEKKGVVIAVTKGINSDEIKEVPAEKLAEWVSLDDEIKDATPTLMVTDYFNTEYGEINESKHHGSARNPGNYRIVSARRHNALDPDTPLPYHLAYFEPEDLY